MMSKKVEKYLGGIDYILPAYFIVSVIEAYTGNWHLNMYIKFLSIVLSLAIVLNSRNSNTITRLTMIFIIYNLCTISMYLFHDRPLSLVNSELFNFIPSILYVYVGASDGREGRFYYDKLEKIAPLILCLGIICYIIPVSWYAERMAELRNSEWYIDQDIYSADNIMESQRFYGFFTLSYAISHYSSFLIGIIMFSMFKKNNIVTKYQYASLFIVYISAVLCQHRVAIVFCTLTIICYIYYALKSHNLSKIKPIIVFFVTLVIVIVAVIVQFADRFDMIYTLVSDRITDMAISKAATSRANNILDNFDFILTGAGLGSGNPGAIMLGFKGVTDAAYVKLLFESGIIGFCLFLLIIGTTIFRALKYYKYYMTELSIMFFILMAMFGSNSLSLAYLYTLPFWYAIGRVWNNHYLHYAINNNIKI